jgi:hypothetical protein
MEGLNVAVLCRASMRSGARLAAHARVPRPARRRYAATRYCVRPSKAVLSKSHNHLTSSARRLVIEAVYPLPSRHVAGAAAFVRLRPAEPRAQTR